MHVSALDWSPPWCSSMSNPTRHITQSLNIDSEIFHRRRCHRCCCCLVLNNSTLIRPEEIHLIPLPRHSASWSNTISFPAAFPLSPECVTSDDFKHLCFEITGNKERNEIMPVPNPLISVPLWKWDKKRQIEDTQSWISVWSLDPLSRPAFVSFQKLRLRQSHRVWIIRTPCVSFFFITSHASCHWAAITLCNESLLSHCGVTWQEVVKRQRWDTGFRKSQGNESGVSLDLDCSNVSHHIETVETTTDSSSSFFQTQ